MNLLKKLMLLPVAFGLITPAVKAAELNIQDVDRYSTEQVTSVSQFSDVRPTDWAYQALSNVVERYGCVAGYPNSTFAGGQSLTRYEAAALLNSCLDRVTETTDEVKKLLAEFSAELTVLRGRVDGLESKVGQLEATQFSTTTKLRGEATFTLGGVPGLETNDGGNVGNTAFNYDLKLNLDTSFTGKDLLRTRLRAGNFPADPFGSRASLFSLEAADAPSNDSSVEIDRLYYQFPVGESLTLTAGALVRNTEMSWVPTVYDSGILDFFTTAGAPGVYNKATGAGVGAQYVGKNGFVAGLNYVAQNGDDSSTGVANEESGLNLLAQVGYQAPNWGVAVGYRYGTEGTRPRSFNGPLGYDGTLLTGQDSNSVAVNAYWQPSKSGIVPSISAGYGYNQVNGDSYDYDTDSWFVGLQWSDVFASGNTAGIAYGQAPTMDGTFNFDCGESVTVDKADILEIFYKFQVTDNISITPAVFYVSNAQRYGDTSNWGGVIQTKFRF